MAKHVRCTKDSRGLARIFESQRIPTSSRTSASLAPPKLVFVNLGIPKLTKTTPLGGKHVEFVSFDMCKEEKGGPYKASIPLIQSTNSEADVLLAYEMNGEVLNRDHGYPLHVVVPGVIGARSVKWLDSINIIGEECQSAICSLEDDNTMQHGKVKVHGYAVSGGGRGIERLDVSFDGGKAWVETSRHQKSGIPYNAIADDDKYCDKWAWVLFEAEGDVLHNTEIVAKALQDEVILSDAERLRMTQSNVKLLQRHFQADTLPWIERMRQKEQGLQRRLLRVMRIVEALEGKGCRVPLMKGEAELAEKLAAITRRVQNLLTIARVQANGGGGGGSIYLPGSTKIHYQSLADMQEVLQQQTEAIARLGNVLKRDITDTETIMAEDKEMTENGS
ncbi:hypothetical protein ACSBR1_036964 [Camellia fascicularis]